MKHFEIKFLLGLALSIVTGSFYNPAPAKAAGLDAQKANLDAKVRAQLPSLGTERAPELPDESVVNTLEQSVVNAYLRNDCPRVFQLVPAKDFTKASGRILAVVAACDPVGKDPDKMFDKARELLPADDSILLLQARFRSQKAMISADELWTLLKSRTKDERVREMAELYLSGHSLDADELLLSRPSTYSGFIQVGTLYELNPSLVSTSDRGAVGTRPSGGETSSGLMRYSHSLSYGSIGAEYFFAQSSYSRSHESDLFGQELGVPLMIKASREASITIRPYMTHTLLGGHSYLSDAGASLARNDTFVNFAQSISVATYYEHYFQNEDRPQQGTHLKLEYSARPRLSALFDLDLSIYIDHASAGEDVSQANVIIPYSNLTTGLIFGIASKGKLSFGGNAVFSYRADDNNSSYLDDFGVATSQIRADFIFHLQPFISYSFGEKRDWQALAIYQYSNVKSNIGATDYIDRNSFNQIFSLSLRRFFSN